jgi:hypothetical protein
MIWQSKEES